MLTLASYFLDFGEIKPGVGDIVGREGRIGDRGEPVELIAVGHLLAGGAGSRSAWR